MKRSNLNLIIDILLLLLFAAVSGIGILMKYIMPSNFSIRHEGATSYASDVLGMNRHEWGYIHWILSLLLLLFILIHIILHWKMIVNIFNRMIPNKIVCYTLCVAILVLVFLFLALPFVFMLYKRK